MRDECYGKFGKPGGAVCGGCEWRGGCRELNNYDRYARREEELSRMVIEEFQEMETTRIEDDE